MLRTRTIVGLFLTSAASLAFEISLTRVFAVQQFHHFAFLVVSLAVMAGAGSGLLATLRPRPPLAGIAFGQGASILFAAIFINLVPFDSYMLALDAAQLAVLAGTFIAAGTPFLLGGWVVAACLRQAGPLLHRAYAVSLVGAAAGSAGALALLQLVPPEAVVLCCAAGAFLGGAVLAATNPAALGQALVAATCLVLAARSPAWLSLRLSPYKPLASARLAQGARLTLSTWSASARLDVIEGFGVHIFPGLSLSAGLDLPEQAALYLDGDGPIPLTAASPDDPAVARLAARMPAGLAYQLRPGASVLLLDPGAGLDALLALGAGATRVTLPTDERLITGLLQGPYAEYSRRILEQPRVHLLPRTGRGALRSGQATYDMIQFCLSDPYHPVASGAFSLSEDYSLTVEAFADALGRLSPDGILVVSRWLQTPPSESVRVLGLLLAALEDGGIEDPAVRLIGFRSMRTATFLVARQPWRPAEIEQTRAFLESNGFDPILLPGLRPDEVNRFNRLPEDHYHTMALAMVADAEAAIAASPFDLRPSTDDRPFFFHFFRWRQTPEVIARLGEAWQPFGGSGYLVLIVLLGLVALLCLPLVLLPLRLLGRRPDRKTGERPHARLPVGRSTLYFASLGLGYMLIEIPLIQQSTLLLDRPTIAVGVVLFTLLLASGMGSRFLAARVRLQPALAWLTLAVATAALAFPPLIQIALGWSLTARLALAAAVVGPLGLLMGIPFAAALRRVEARDPGLVPWAWGVNGAASGVAGVLAALLALGLGLTAAVLLGGASYLLACAAAAGLDQPGGKKRRDGRLPVPAVSSE